jgi:hypothetical protein
MSAGVERSNLVLVVIPLFALVEQPSKDAESYDREWDSDCNPNCSAVV